MKRKLTSLVVMFAMVVAGVLTTIQVTTPTASAIAPADCPKNFLTFPVWYRGLIDPNSTDCSLISPTDSSLGGGNDRGIGTFIGIIALNVIEMVLQLIGYIAAFFIIYGGFLYMTQSYEAGKLEKAQKTIMNAIVGLVISIFSVAIVNLVFGAIT